MLPSLPPVSPIRSTQPTFFYLELNVLVEVFKRTTNVFVEYYQQLDNRYHNVKKNLLYPIIFTDLLFIMVALLETGGIESIT